VTDAVSIDRRLPRPGPAADRGPLDDVLYDLVETRFRRILLHDPVAATALGIHELDDRLGPATRDSVLGELAADRAHLAAVEAVDPDGLSGLARFERDLEIHNLRLEELFAGTLRRWERGSKALETLGDGLFLVFAGDSAPLRDRLVALSGRLEEAPRYLREHRTRAAGPQVLLWQRRELESAATLPELVTDIETAADGVLDAPESRRLARAAAAAREAIADYGRWLETTLAGATAGWAIGRELHDEAIERRALGDRSADEILELGWEQLARNREARVAAGRQIDPGATEAEIVDRIKSDHPASFEAALEAYRDAMARARQHCIDRGIVTVPADERLLVVPTPVYLRRSMPFAACFAAPAFDLHAPGIYVVTPSVDGDARAMREHSFASISNTSIHEAYPGHHLQLKVASRHPSLSRLLANAPEFVEGWGMYCEQMMREEGFDDGPAFRVAMATDAIWRAARIILDIRMHRGELDVDEATEFLVEQTGFERPNARAEVERYTSTPTYQLSYLLGRVLILELREDERRRLGDAFSQLDFHDALMRNGSIPVSFHRRLLADPVEA
jgi:uncharacterized protein (DUF885 family)